LSGPPGHQLPVSAEPTLQEYITAQQASAERPEAQTNLGNLYAGQGKEEPAVTAYHTAIELDPAYIPAYADKLRSLSTP
jgi:lipopolysaccharide biosynthesis regulator YciM